MHVVFVDTTLTTFPVGGGQTFLVSLAGGLRREGWDVSVVSQPGPEHSVADALRGCGARVHTDLWDAGRLPEERARLLADWVAGVRADVYVVSISPDVGWLALPFLREDTATLSIAHNDVYPFYDPLTHYGRFIDCAVGVSEETARQVTLRGKMPPERARYIPYGVRSLSAGELEARGERPAGPLRLGYVGRVVQPQKRVLDFVPLAAELSRRAVDFELHLIGDGDERGQLEEAFRSAGLDRHVTFWGWLGPERVASRLRELDVFVLLSEMEGLPVALLEAMGHGLVPVVTRTASGNTQLVRDGFNGYVVGIGDTRALADRVESLARDCRGLVPIRQRAWESAQGYSVERMIERYRECFDHLLDPKFDRGHRPAPGRFPVMPYCRSRYPAWLRKLKSRAAVLRRPDQPPQDRNGSSASADPFRPGDPGHLTGHRPDAPGGGAGAPPGGQTATRCIACQGGRLRSLGPLPPFPTETFLGVPLRDTVRAGELIRCVDCEIRFRFPTPDPEQLRGLYSVVEDGGLWTYGKNRQVWSVIAGLIADAPERSVLDVGCFRGDFLDFLGGTWQRYGVEPSEIARRHAEARGITILADCVEALEGAGERFGAIVMVDVIEHLTNPLETLERLSGMLLPGGRLVIFTGSTDAWSWRLAGNDYWYSALPEHVAFFSPAWFRWAASRLGVKVGTIRRLRHHPAPLVARLDESLKNIAYVSYRRVLRFPRLAWAWRSLPVLGRVAAWRSAWWTSARDHILVDLVKT